jgi:aspartyl-tRNA(Asn)/glutamyl-tRNA(Gln) amidotransferase subunit C
MKLTVEEVRHVAFLARLGLPEADLEALTTELTRILDYVDKISELDTSAIPPTAQVGDVVEAYREDEVRPSIGTEVALANAPDREGPYFRVAAMQE